MYIYICNYAFVCIQLKEKKSWIWEKIDENRVTGEEVCGEIIEIQYTCINLSKEKWNKENEVFKLSSYFLLVILLSEHGSPYARTEEAVLGSRS